MRALHGNMACWLRTDGGRWDRRRVCSRNSPGDCSVWCSRRAVPGMMLEVQAFALVVAAMFVVLAYCTSAPRACPPRNSSLDNFDFTIPTVQTNPHSRQSTSPIYVETPLAY